MEKKELKVENIRSRKRDRLEVAEVKKQQEREKPFLDNRDMVFVMCVICALLITYILYCEHFFICETNGQLASVIAASIFFFTIVSFWTTQKIVRHCYMSAKRKAAGQADD